MKEMAITTFDYIRKKKTMLVIVSGFWLLQWYFWHSLCRIYRLGFLLRDGVYGTMYGIFETIGHNPRLILGIPFLLSSVVFVIGSQFRKGKFLSLIAVICLILETVLILIIVLNILSPIDRTAFSLS